MKNINSPAPAAGQPQDTLMISYLALRKAIGVLGIVFPFVLLTGSVVLGDCDVIQESISHYYHTNMRDVFVGILCTVSLFLYAYRGYERIDNIMGNLGCVFGLGVAFLPTTFDAVIVGCNMPLYFADYIGRLHLLSASLFFGVLIFFSLILFTKSANPAAMTVQKHKRNKVYISCGYFMMTCIGLLAVYFIFLEKRFPLLDNLHPVFWLESLALEAFGISWIVKGEFLLADK